MYREHINLLAFSIGIVIALSAGTAFADPATEETISQMNEFVVVLGMVFSFCMGALFGHMR